MRQVAVLMARRGDWGDIVCSYGSAHGDSRSAGWVQLTALTTRSLVIRKLGASYRQDAQTMPLHLKHAQPLARAATTCRAQRPQLLLASSTLQHLAQILTSRLELVPDLLRRETSLDVSC